MSDKKKASQVWGKRSAEFFAELEGQVVVVAVVTDQKFKGQLVGVDTYDVMIRQESGLELLIPKSNVIYVHRGNTG